VLLQTLSVNSNFDMTQAPMSAWFYTDEGGLKQDPFSTSTSKRDVHINRYSTKSSTLIKDDGLTVSAPVYVKTLSNSTETPADSRPFDLTGFQAQRVIFQNTVAPFGPGMKMTGSVVLSWNSYLDVEAGAIKSITCAIRQSKNWDIMWTGQPTIDYLVTKAGRTMFNLMLDAIVYCPSESLELVDFKLEWDLEFQNDFRQDPWRFGLRSVLTALTNDPLASTLTPAIATSMQPTDDTSATHTVRNIRSLRPTNLYPAIPFPSAPPQKPKTRFAKIFAKLKIKSHSAK